MVEKPKGGKDPRAQMKGESAERERAENERARLSGYAEQLLATCTRYGITSASNREILKKLTELISRLDRMTTHDQLAKDAAPKLKRVEIAILGAYMERRIEEAGYSERDRRTLRVFLPDMREVAKTVDLYNWMRRLVPLSSISTK